MTTNQRVLQRPVQVRAAVRCNESRNRTDTTDFITFLINTVRDKFSCICYIARYHICLHRFKNVEKKILTLKTFNK